MLAIHLLHKVEGRITMAQSVMVEIHWPKDWQKFKLPPPLQERLQELLDRQDRQGKLTARERREAKALVDLTEMLSLLHLRAEIATKRAS